MNWLGDFIQTHVEPEDTVLDLGCGIMQATLDVIPAYPKTRLQCKRLLGVDVYQPYLDFLKEKGIETMSHDLTQLPLPFADQSFDVVLMTDLLEHLKLYQSENLVKEAQRIARKKIIMSSPTTFRRNEYGASSDFAHLGLNVCQYHQCLISKEWLKRFGFKTFEVTKGQKCWVCIRPAKLKILHVWNQAGVSSLMAKYQRKLGHQADILGNYGFDGLKIDKFYDIIETVNQPTPVKHKRKMIGYSRLPKILKKHIRLLRRKYRSAKFYWTMMKKARSYDVIHIHSSSLSWFLTIGKPRIMEYHGSDIRRRKPRKKKGMGYKIDRMLMLIISRFTKLYFSTSDMLYDLPHKSEWIPNPVDKEHFTRKNPFKKGTALYLTQWYESADRAKQIAKRLGLHLTLLDRLGIEGMAVENKAIDYKDFPRYLEAFEYLIGRHVIPSLSKTALEALALGLKVVDWEDKILTGLLDIHNPEYVAERTIDLYYSVIGG